RRDSLQKTPPHFEHGSHETQPPETAVLPRISVDLEDLQEPQALAVRLTGGTEESPAAWRAVRSDARPINDNNAEPDRFQDPPVDLLSDAAIPSPPHLPGDIASPSHQPVGADFSHQTLELIQAELETMLRGSTRLWSFDELIAKTQEIASGTDVPEIQSESLELLGTLDRLEKIRRRHQQLITSTAGSTLASASSGTRPRPESADGAVGLEKAIRLARDRFAPYRPSAAPGQSLPTTASRTAGIAGIRGASDGTRNAYDGSGRLTTVHSTRQGAPQYALTDSDGRILQLVEPQPGLNLRPYLRQQVGLIGRQSYAADLQKPVLTAERVVVINRR
ncbi:MAG: hypothetical protein O2931_04065, partial [Planctomycetota bacterium]|nr:hypothetical protein [Planctomycetota bacterium]